MRKKIVAQRSLFDQTINLLPSIFKPEKKLKRMDTIIDANPEILEAVQRGLTGHIKQSGRKGLSVERILRCAILKQYKEYSYRELYNRINDGVSLRWFTRFYSTPAPHFTAFQKTLQTVEHRHHPRHSQAYRAGVGVRGSTELGRAATKNFRLRF